MNAEIAKIPDDQDWKISTELPYYVSHHLPSLIKIISMPPDDYRLYLEDLYTHPDNASHLNVSTGKDIHHYLNQQFLELLVVSDLYHPYLHDICTGGDIGHLINKLVERQRRLVGDVGLGLDLGLLNHEDQTCKLYDENSVANHCRINQMITVHGIGKQKLSGELLYFFSVWAGIKAAGIISENKVSNGNLVDHLDYLRTLGDMFNNGGITFEQEEFQYLGKRYNLPKIRFTTDAADHFLGSDSTLLLTDFVFVPQLGIYFPEIKVKIKELTQTIHEDFWQLFK